jgi:3-deoxy-D-manno-octulosonic-acid transferase
MKFQKTVLILIYRGAISPLGVMLAVTVGALLVPKIREGLRLRRAHRDWPKFPLRPVWIHASSGEFEYAKPFIRELKLRHPKLPVVVTYFSPTFAKAIQNFAGVDFSLPLPLDLPGPCRNFLEKINPQVGFIARTDLWPEILAQAEERKIPVLLFSATKTKTPSLVVRMFTRWMWSYLKAIFCVTEADAANITAVDPTMKTVAIGDTRFDQVIQRLQSPKPVKDELRPTRAKTLVVGSSWKEDEAVLLPAIKKALQNRRIQVVIAPHEPTKDHIDNLKSQFVKLNVPVQVYSETTHFDSGVLLIDKIGILAEIYQWGAVALVGGSFKGSVHSVMEPLAAGCFTLVGPHHRNNREALEFQNASIGGTPMVLVASDSKNLETSIDLCFARWTEKTATGIRREIESRSGASRRLVDFLDLRTNPVSPSAEM